MSQQSILKSEKFKKFSHGFAGFTIIFLILIVWLVSGEDTPEEVVLRTETLNHCEDTPEEADFFRGAELSLREGPNIGISRFDDKISFCDNLSVEVLEEKEIEGQVWLGVC